MTAPRNPIPYASPETTPVAVNGLLGWAKAFAAAGLLVPFSGLLTASLALIAVTRRPIAAHAKRKARRWFAIGLAVCVLNPFVYVLVLLPNTGGSRPAANVMKCTGNLRQIGLAVQMYANEYGDSLPASLAPLLLTQDLTPDVFICPSNDCKDDLARPQPATSQQIAAAVTEGTSTCSYLLCRFGDRKLADLPPNAVLMFEKSGNHVTQTDGMNVLLVNGTVKWVPRERCNAVMSELASGQNPPPTLNGVP